MEFYSIKQSFSDISGFPLVEVSFAGQYVVVGDYVVVFEAVAVEDRIKTVIEVSLVCVGLQGRPIKTALGFLVPHFPDLRLSPVFFLPLEPHHTSSADLVDLIHISGVELQRFDEGVDETLVREGGRDGSLILFSIGVNDCSHGVFEDVVVGLGLGVLHSADGAPDYGFGDGGVLNGSRYASVESLGLDYSRHAWKFILKK